jgi:hypothetical protein
MLLIEVSELAIAIATMVFGGGRLFAQFRRVDTVEDLRDALERFTAREAFQPDAKEADVVLRFLNFSALIMGPLRSKLIHRLLLLTGCVFLTAPIPLVLVQKGTLTNDAKGWAITASVALVQVLSAFLTGKFLRPEESEFLQNSRILHDRFYQLYVLPAMFAFNNAARISQVLGPAREGAKIQSLTDSKYVIDQAPDFLRAIFKPSLIGRYSVDTKF